MAKKQVLLVAAVATFMVAGCGKKPAFVPAPPVSTGVATPAPLPSMDPLGDPFGTEETQLPDAQPSIEPLVDEAEEDEVASEATATASASPSPSPSPSTSPSPSPTPTPTPTPTPSPSVDPTIAQTPTYLKSLGEGSLHSAVALAASEGYVYVVDNARTGLLGKFASVRKYDVASGAFKQSFENIGWAGAKNMPTTVDRVRLDAGKVVAANSSSSYVFNADGSLVTAEEGSFTRVTDVECPKTGDHYAIVAGDLVRLHNGNVMFKFGRSQVGDAVALAISEDGTLFVSNGEGAVHVFKAPAQ